MTMQAQHRAEQAPAPSVRRGRFFAQAFLAAAVLVILVICFGGSGNQGGGVRFCVLCPDDRASASALLNLLLFVPFGAAAYLNVGTVGRAFLLGAAFSAAIEFAQIFVPGRFVAVADLVMNSTGTLVGAWLAAHARTILVPPARWARRTPWLTALAIASIIAGTAALFGPSVPAAHLYGGWTPRLASLDVYDGRVLDAHAGTVDVPIGPVPDTRALRDALERGDTVGIRFIAGTQPTRLAPIFQIVDEERQEAFFLGAEGTDLVARLRYRADDLRLDRPMHRLAGAMAGTQPGDTVRVRLSRDPGIGPALAIGDVSPAALEVTVSRGWSLLLHPRVLQPNQYRILDALWMALLCVPLGWWSRTPARVAAPLLLVIATMALLGRFTPGMAPALPAYVGAAVGAFAGVLLASIIDRPPVAKSRAR